MLLVYTLFYRYVNEKITSNVGIFVTAGLKDIYQNNTYFTLNGKIPAFIDWRDNEPNGLSEHCVGIYEKQLFDIPCQPSKSQVLCQRISGKCNLIFLTFHLN